jgi:signal transduction histidine kinase
VSVAILALLSSAVTVLVVSTRRAQRLARQQMDFVAGVSHELKTPLTAMRSAGQNLADGIVDSPEKVRKYGALIEREGRRLTEMVGRVLTFAGIQSGSQAFQFQAVSVEELVEGVLADCRWVLEERKVQLEKNVAPDLPEVHGDAAALRQAIANLIDNALKYGGGSKWIGLEARTAASSDGGEIVVSVADRGIGIGRSDLPHLFDPFFRSSDPSAAGTSGSGLGLAVVRGIVTAHGGKVTVESAPGKGSTFSIHLPVAPATAGKGESA